MDKFKITGGVELKGSIKVNGAKNFALKILPAMLLSNGKNKLTNFPFIEDTSRMIEIVQGMGGEVIKDVEKKELTLDTTNIKEAFFDEILVKKLRASIIMVGPLLSRFGRVEMFHPGGCVIGKRPIDFFIEGFQSFGAKIEWKKDSFVLTAPSKGLIGADIFFPKISVTGTETMIMTATLARGKTVLKNCAMEPEIPALANYLNSRGAKIKGAGTSMITIEGVKEIQSGECRVIPDRIETGTFLVMGLATNSEIEIADCNPEDLGTFIKIIEKVGAKLEIGLNKIKTRKTKKLKAVSIATHEFPGFATDLQSPYTLLMTQAHGTSLIHETIYEGRLFFTDQLNVMGANIVMCDPHRVVVNGPTLLQGRKLISPDLRAGITMVLAGMIAKGETIIENIYQIDRGYEKIEKRLIKLGAKIERIN